MRVNSIHFESERIATVVCRTGAEMIRKLRDSRIGENHTRRQSDPWYGDPAVGSDRLCFMVRAPAVSAFSPDMSVRVLPQVRGHYRSVPQVISNSTCSPVFRAVRID
ncbi:hypothetical protein JOF55_002602 [Haloactinomyces albus]|uniref:Uncharacterized protein n=1 Tax=Haloactinomyces albus TaxID=1352928 RepID=A0AAE3ZCK4_9ACTN|nr:hypothetical protein [Haloactinomyces albus]